MSYEKPLIQISEKTGKDNRNCDYYSDDFETESDEENPVGAKSSNKKEKNIVASSNLIESVMFSDCSDEEILDVADGKTTKQSDEFVFKLSANDAKVSQIYDTLITF